MDWRYYAEKLRKARFDLDESEIKPYLPLERIIEAAFYVRIGCSGSPSRHATTCRSIRRTCAF